MAKKKIEKVGIEAEIDILEKKYGMSRAPLSQLTVTSTGSIQLNLATNIGGTPLGKMIEIFGPESSGKSTIVLHQIAEYQKAFPERRAVLIDFEHSFDSIYASSIGVNTDTLLLYQPDNQEQGYDMILGLIQKEIASLIVIDSQTAAAPKAVVDGEMGDATIAIQARNNSKFCLKVKGLLSLHNTTLIFVSQTRDRIGGMGETSGTTGGNAIKFYADMRWKIWKMNDKAHESNKTTIDVIKNKLGNPFGQAKVDILWGKGFDKMGEIIDYAVQFDIIQKGGAWYAYGETKLGQGIEKTKQLFEDNPELYEEIYNKVMWQLNNKEEEPEEINENL